MFGGSGSFCEDEQPGDTTIEAVYKLCSAGRGGAAKIFADAGDEGVRFTAIGGNGEKFCFFINNDQIGVFEDNSKTSIEMHFRSFSGRVVAALFVADLNQITGPNWSAGLNFQLPIDLHTVVVKEPGDEASRTADQLLDSAISASVDQRRVGMNLKVTAFDGQRELAF